VITALLVTVGWRFLSGSALGMSARTREITAMDTLIRITVYKRATRTRLDRIIDGAFDLIGRLEGELSAHNDSSEVSLINSNAGKSSVSVSPRVFQAVDAARKVAVVTKGCYDPTIGPLSALWRVGDRRNPRDELPARQEIAQALELVGYEGLDTSIRDVVYLKREGMALDLGGVAKGYISGVVSNYLKRQGIRSAVIDLGGNVMVIGGRPNGEPWRIGIQHPQRHRGTPICSIAARDTSLITAGVYERFSSIDGRRYTHIFNPITGSPIEGNLLSVTVITRDPTMGDALSTAFMVMGAEKSMELLRTLPGIEAVFVSQGTDGKMELLATEGISDSLEILDNEVRR
jgi:thiamine biosynthesis lipoprotein